MRLRRLRVLSVAAALAAGLALALPGAAGAWPHPPAGSALVQSRCVPRFAQSIGLRALHTCVPRVRVRVHNQAEIGLAAADAAAWCVVTNSKPGAPWSMIGSAAVASRWCKTRKWYYVIVSRG